MGDLIYDSDIIGVRHSAGPHGKPEYAIELHFRPSMRGEDLIERLTVAIAAIEARQEKLCSCDYPDHDPNFTSKWCVVHDI